MRRKWIVISALAALLLTGAVTGTAFAQSESSDDSSTVSRFVEILAGKLGIGQEELQTAVDETREELEAERKAAWEQQLRDKLAAMVESGKLTQEQADAYLDRYLGAPELGPGDGRGKKFGFGRGHHGGKRGGSPWGFGGKSWDKGSDKDVGGDSDKDSDAAAA